MELKITGTLVLDLGDFIDAVQAEAGAYMLPDPEGLFMPGKCEPTLDKSQQYFYAGQAINNVAQPIPITDFNAPITDDVFNDRAELVVLKTHVKHLKKKARYSLQARNMIVEIIDHLIRNHARWTGTQASGIRQSNVSGAIRPFLLPQYQRSGITVDVVQSVAGTEVVDGMQWRTKEKHAVSLDPVDGHGVARITENDKALFYTSQDICDTIMLQLNDLVRQLTDFLGQDRWIMHFMKVDNVTVRIERTIDYRIYSWMREHGRELDD